MATLSHSESRRLYSWWWDSHISPKNSKWLQENLTDMDAKVKAMIKLIEEDADSFARRAEMYYKKRPELMKLVEEFYRAYRALAERYDHATVELRHAHRTMVEAFPNQVPYALADESPSGSSAPDCEPHTPEMARVTRALYHPEELQKDSAGLSGGAVPQNSKVSDGSIRRGLIFDELKDSERNLQNGLSELSRESKPEHAGEVEAEIQTLKKTLTEVEAEKEAVFMKYQHALEKLSNLEQEINHAQKDAGGLNERAGKAEIEVKILKEALGQLEGERDDGLLQYNQCLERISSLETSLSVAQEDVKGLNERSVKAENEAQTLKQRLSRLNFEKDSSLLQYRQCLEKISILEAKISAAEENARTLNEEIEKSEADVKALKKALDQLNEEKETASLQYQKCLEKITKMENEISNAHDDARRLNGELSVVSAKLESTEERCALLEHSNQSLQLEADNLMLKIALKDQELAQKLHELEKLQLLMEDEQSRFQQVETTLHTLQRLHAQSQEEQKALTAELRNGLQMLKDLDLHKHGMEKDLMKIKEENKKLTELNFCFTDSVRIMEKEIFSLREMKEKLEEEVVRKADEGNTLAQEIHHLRDEMGSLNTRYQAIMEQLDEVGLNPESVGPSVKNLQDENYKLREACEKERNKRDALYEKLDRMDEISKENAVLKISLAEVNGELERSRENVKQFQESCQFLQGEKSGLAAEKAVLLSQLQMITENIQKLLEKNTLLEHSLSGANVELESLRAKSQSLEEVCQLLKSEKSNLLNERETLISQLENVQRRLESLEMRFSKLEERCADLETGKESTIHLVEDLRFSLVMEKEEHDSFKRATDARLSCLENQVSTLEESRLGKKDFEEELDKAVNAQVEIFILQKFVEDLEQKNFSLLVECQKHDEASRWSDRLISKLESENLEQQVEIEFLLDEIEKLRAGIHQVFKVLQFGPETEHDVKTEQEQAHMADIVDRIDDLKSSLFISKDETGKLHIENSTLLTLLRELKLEGAEIMSRKNVLEQELKCVKGQLCSSEKERQELLEIKSQLISEVRDREQQQQVVKAEFENLCVRLATLEGDYQVLQKANMHLNEEKKCLLKKIDDLHASKHTLEEEHGEIIQEAVALSVFSLVSEDFITEKAVTVKSLVEDLYHIHAINCDLKEEVRMLVGKLEVKETENLHLNQAVEKLESELLEVRDLNDQLSHQILLGNDFLRKMVVELSEAEQELEGTKNLNMKLCDTAEELRMACEDSVLIRQILSNENLELAQNSKKQKSEIQSLHEINENLNSEVAMLHKEIEECRIREENLSSELQERRDEFELWEAEAATFYFDLQVSAFREVLYENKTQELTQVCESIADDNAAKKVEISCLREKISLLESEVGGLKAQLSACIPAIASLSNNVESLEHNVFPRSNRFRSFDQPGEEREDQGSVAKANGIQKPRTMEEKIKAVQKAVVEEKEMAAKQETATTEHREEANIEQTIDWKLEDSPGREATNVESMPPRAELYQNPKSLKDAPELGILMKDIPLDQESDFHGCVKDRRDRADANDQMLELWETAEDCSKEPAAAEIQNQPTSVIAGHHQAEEAEQLSAPLASEAQAEKELGVDWLQLSSSSRRRSRGKHGKIRERLSSDAEKLTNLQNTVQDLKRRMELNVRSTRASNTEYESIRKELTAVEEAIVELVDVNGQLIKEVEESPPALEEKAAGRLGDAGMAPGNGLSEKAKKGAEKIGRLQFEVQNIQHVLLKLEDGTEMKGKNKFSGIVLKDFISNSKSTRRRKACFCACTRPPTTE